MPKAAVDPLVQHAPHDAMVDAGEIARFHRFLDPRQSASGRWEMWMDGVQARAVRGAEREDAPR